MEELLRQMAGKKLDVTCMGAIAVRGENLGVSDGILRIKDDEGKTYFISVTSIVAVSEVLDSQSRPGFIGSSKT
ncbi:MAG TPA: MM0924 family protein [Pyrinomonadaceae bacterium]|nr:MM0924 family protein [Pyrinomonadaceae bacterium]